MLDRAPDQRILKGAPATLRAELADQDGEADASIDSGVTVTIARLDGTALVTAQAATTTSNGAATYDLTAAQTGAGLDVLTATWTHNSVVRATTVHEVVGAFWFPASALRALSGVAAAQNQQPGDTSVQALIDARTRAESLFEWATGVAWVPRTALEYHDACGHDRIILDCWYPRTLRSLTIDGTAQTVGDFTLDEFSIRRTTGGPIYAANVRGVAARVDHGRDAPPTPLRDAAMRAAAHWLKADRTSVVSPRLTGMSLEGNTVSFARVDRDNPTGIPEVDGIIAQYRKARIGVA